MAGAVTRRSVVAGGLCAALAPMVGACGGGNTLKVWAIGNEAAKLPGLVDKLGIGSVDIQALPWSAAHSKLLTSFAGGSLPDVAQVGNSWIAELDAIGALDPVPAGQRPRPGRQFDAVLESNRIDGRLVGLPWYVDTRVQFYRTDLFGDAGYDAPPTEWMAWKRALHAVKKAKGGDGFAILLPLDEFEHLQTFALSAGASFLRDDGTRGNFRSHEFVEALRFYTSLFDEGLAPRISGAEISNRWAEFARGWFALYPSGPWMIEEMRTRLPDDMQDKWATAPNPGPQGPGAAAPGGSSLVVFAKGTRKAEAWSFARRLLTDKAQIALHTSTGNLPAVRPAWSEAKLLSDPVVAPFAEQLGLARPLPKVPEWERVVSEMQVVAEHLVREGGNVREAAAEMDRRVDAILAKRRWMIERKRAA